MFIRCETSLSCRCLALASLLILGLAAAPPVAAETSRSDFSRIVNDGGNRPLSLQLAIITYEFDDAGHDAQIDLIAAAHIADQSFYAELNDRFEAYDALLYELVAPSGMVIRPGMKPGGLVTGAQRTMAEMLELSLQLEEIDYTADNFVHADLTPSQFRAAMKERDESLYTYAWALFFAAMRDYRKDPLGIRSWQAFVDGATGQQEPLKLLLARDFANLDGMADMLGDDTDSTIIGARNARAVEVLQEELEAGRSRVGIFYGAAHMRDLEERLVAIGLRPVRTTWVDAWALQ